MSSLDTTNACGTKVSHQRWTKNSFTSCWISVSPTVDQEQFYIMLDMSELTEPSYLPWISQHSFTSCWMLLFTPFKMNPVLHLVGCVGTYRTTLSPLDKLNNSFISCRIWLSSTISPIKRSHTVLYHVWIWAPDLG